MSRSNVRFWRVTRESEKAVPQVAALPKSPSLPMHPPSPSVEVNVLYWAYKTTVCKRSSVHRYTESVGILTKQFGATTTNVPERTDYKYFSMFYVPYARVQPTPHPYLSNLGLVFHLDRTRLSRPKLGSLMGGFACSKPSNSQSLE